MSKLILYTSELSPATRSTKILIQILGLDVEYRPIDVLNGEQLKPDFLKINPTHTLPTLDDNGFILWDSHAINTYLITKYGGDNHELYPNDVVERSKIDQFLHFDGSTLFPRFGAIVVEICFINQSAVSEMALNRAVEALSFLNTFLENSNYLTGDKLTVADISCASVPVTFERLLPEEYKKFDNVKAWINRLRSDLPFFDEIHVEKLNVLEKFFFDKMEENKK
ncbi:Glutathione S-transferase D7 [Pseudolycoriella hygida]|uniref:glutathione transferase n=1 Tax=Pseudolycoriella hygida TaxID=35572 RepID=A0A9Q0MTQ7_9DIPT|nr:Glutathione S-transferase D7 [Pseudolycoriella hygida]